MRRAGILLASAFLSALLWGASARAGAPGDGSPLSTPGNFSLAPILPAAPAGPLAGALPGASPPLLQGGAVSQSFGSGGLHSTAIELDSGLLGGSTRAFLQAATGQGPHFHDLPAVSGSSVAVGVQTALPYGSVLSVSVATGQERLGRGGNGFFP